MGDKELRNKIIQLMSGVENQGLPELVSLGDLAVPILEQLLQDPNGRLRVRAAIALGEIMKPSSIYALKGAIKSNDKLLSVAAVDAIGKIRNRQVPIFLLTLLDDEDLIIRQRAIKAFARMDKGILAKSIKTERLIRKLRSIEKTDENDFVRTLAKSVISKVFAQV